MKKIFVLGSAGMLGHTVLTYLKELGKYEIYDASYPTKVRPESLILDATDKNDVEQTIESIKPDVIINCIGILIKGSKQNPATAIYLNSFLPHHLVQIQRKIGGKLIHISTDCVFSGQKGSYIETDFKDARDTYGLSKALGEVDNEFDLTFRTSIVGPELKMQGEGLFHWLMSQKGHINGYTQEFWGGVTTLELARAIDNAIDQNLIGLYHLTPGYPISKYDLISLMKKIWGMIDIEIEPESDHKSNKSLITKRSDFNFTAKSYENMLIDLFEFMIRHKEYYPHYNY